MEKAFSPRDVLSLNSQTLLTDHYKLTVARGIVVFLRHVTEHDK
jgi:hypothetical protein